MGGPLTESRFWACSSLTGSCGEIMPALRSMSRKAAAETVDGARKASAFSLSFQNVTVRPCVYQRTPKAERMPLRNVRGSTCSKRPLICPLRAGLHTEP